MAARPPVRDNNKDKIIKAVKLVTDINLLKSLLLAPSPKEQRELLHAEGAKFNNVKFKGTAPTDDHTDDEQVVDLAGLVQIIKAAQDRFIELSKEKIKQSKNVESLRKLVLAAAPPAAAAPPPPPAAAAAAPPPPPPVAPDMGEVIRLISVEFLSNYLHGHLYDDKLLTSAAVPSLVDEAKKRLAELVIDSIKGSKDPTQLKRLAIASIAADAANDIRTVLDNNVQFGRLNLENHTGNEDLISNDNATLAGTEAKKRIHSCIKEKISGIKHGDLETLEGLIAAGAAVLKEDKATAIRAHLNDNANLGSFNFDTGTNDDQKKAMLSDDDAIKLQEMAIQKHNELVITHAIQNLNIQNIPDLGNLQAIFTARDSTEFLRVINRSENILGKKENFSPANSTLTSARLSTDNEQIIKKAAQDRYNELRFELSIKQCRDANILKDIATATAATGTLDDAIKAVLKKHFRYFGVTDASSAENISHDKLEAMMQLASANLALLSANPIKGHILQVEPGSVADLGFVAEITTAGATSTAVAPPAQAHVSASQQSPAKYAVKGLAENELITSKKTFGATAPAITATLTQNYKNEVKYSKDHEASLDDRAASETALEMARMLLSNYKVGRGDIIIRGHDTKQATKLHAALLFLLKDVPKGHPLHGVKIKSFVNDASQPEPTYWARVCGKFTQSQLDDAFINKHFLKDVDGKDIGIKTQAESIREQLHGLTKSVKQMDDSVKKCKEVIRLANLHLSQYSQLPPNQMLAFITNLYPSLTISAPLPGTSQELINNIEVIFKHNTEITDGKELEEDLNQRNFRIK